MTVARGERFRYERYELDAAAQRLECHYSLDGRRFVERVTFPGGGRWDDPAAPRAARLVFLLAGVSYYKTGAPPVIDLGDEALTDAEEALLRAFYVEGLGEFAYENGLDLGDLRFEASRRPRDPITYRAPSGRPLIPFGGGIDSIVTVELLRPRVRDAALFVVTRPGDRFTAIEEPAAVTGLPLVRAEREIDPQVLRSRELGFLNGHVPVTGILSAIAVLAAVLEGRDAVVMSNEWSASVPTLVDPRGRAVNHQYSKGAEFERAFRDVLDETLGEGLRYFSLLRARTELWIAQRFAGLRSYHDTFRSCNRAFAIDPARRLDHWCGRCDKCCFIDLILSPFLSPDELGRIFDGREPFGDESLADRFATLLGTSEDSKPFECVGDVGESRAALLLAAERDDRAAFPLVHALVDRVRATGEAVPATTALLRPVGADFVPDDYAATDDLLV